MPRAFKLIQTLGEGSFGAVHLAEVAGDEGFVQRLAVKWLLPQWSHDAELAGRLRDEARLLGLLSHEHIVRVHGLTRIDGRLAILMEPIDGVDLSRLDGQPAPPRAALEIVGAVADALDAAWQTVPPGGTEPLRVVHRDIKPSNVMVSARGGVKVMDFGVARATFEAREAHTRSQQFGTARYMAPERWLEGIADAPSDVFSLGITLIELVGGRPVERPRLSVDGFHDDIERALSALAPWPPIRELATRMCAFVPADRPPAAEVASACRAIASHLPGEGLRDWAPGFLGTYHAHKPGVADGTIVHEDASAETFIRSGTERLDPTTTAPLRAPLAAEAPTVRRRLSIRWNQAMTTLAIAATTVLAVSAWQYMRHEATQVVDAVPIAAIIPPSPRVDPPSDVVGPVPQPAPVAVEAVEPPTAATAVVEPPITAVRQPPPVDPPVIAEVVAEPAPDPTPVEAIVMTFIFDDELDRVTLTPGGPVEFSHRGVWLPKGTVSTVTIAPKDGGEPFRCTITADSAHPRYTIDRIGRTCR